MLSFIGGTNVTGPKYLFFAQIRRVEYQMVLNTVCKQFLTDRIVKDNNTKKEYKYNH